MSGRKWVYMPPVQGNQMDLADRHKCQIAALQKRMSDWGEVHWNSRWFRALPALIWAGGDLWDSDDARDAAREIADYGRKIGFWLDDERNPVLLPVWEYMCRVDTWADYESVEIIPAFEV